VLDAAGSEIRTVFFNPHFSDEESDGRGVSVEEIAVPWEDSVREVRLRRWDGVVLHSISASANPPSVHLLYPNGGEHLTGATTVQWSAADSDGDSLRFLVKYSHDGGVSWRVVGVVDNALQLQIDFSTLPGGSTGLVAVEASDGFWWQRDSSDGFLSVPDKPPSMVLLSSPATADYGAPTRFRAEAYDPEDGYLTGAALRWSSDRDGPLGTGGSVDPVLSIGRHQISVGTQDSHGHGTVASFAIDVNQPGTSFYTVTPCRLLDTRQPTGHYGAPALRATDLRRFVAWGRCGIPATAKAVAGNATVTEPTGSGHITLYAGDSLPPTSTINFRGSQTRANSVILPIGHDGTIGAVAAVSGGSVQLLFDVTGYFD
jgi:hypothetical protein